MGNCLQGHTADDISLLHDESDVVNERLGPPPPYQVRNFNANLFKLKVNQFYCFVN